MACSPNGTTSCRTSILQHIRMKCTYCWPHGCDKTTVLKIILSVARLNQGTVTVFGFEPSHAKSGIPGIRVGCTPRSCGLHLEFTINEMFRYFGKMLNLYDKYIDERTCLLSNLFTLPPGKRLVKNCSESEKRQMSFAIAVLHEPELLILDEPCTGVDPVLKNSILEHLKLIMSKEDHTIFMTTQNLAEANMADRL